MVEGKVYHFPVIIEQDEDGIYVATVPGLRGCHTQAKKLAELDSRIREAVALCIEDESERAVELPQNKFIGVHELEIALWLPQRLCRPERWRRFFVRWGSNLSGK